MSYYIRAMQIYILVIGVLFGLGQSKMWAQTDQEVFKPSGKVWGYAFGDYYIKMDGDTSTWSSRAEYSSVPKDVNAFSFRRMYLGYDYKISPVFSTQALLEGGDGVRTTKGERSVFIKSLHLRWKNIFKGSDLLIGQMSTPTFALVTDKIWGYRSLEKTIADQRGIRSSSDMGVALHGRLDSAGNVGYHFLIGIGTGPKPEELTKEGSRKVFYGEVYAYLFDRKLLLDLYADYQPVSADQNVMSMKSLVAYRSDPFTMGVELLSQRQKGAKSDGTNVTPFGYSIWARGRIVKDRWYAYARYDSFDPDSKYRVTDVLSSFDPAKMSKHYSEHFMTVGLEYTPHPLVHLMPNIWINTYKPKTETDIQVERKADIVPRLTFFFEFR